MQTCPKCKGFYWREKCDCEEFQIQYDGENYTVRAGHADEAAEKFAKKELINSDYSFLGDSIDFLVNGKPYRVGAEQSINYSVNEL